jgi:hypothetical protein
MIYRKHVSISALALVIAALACNAPGGSGSGTPVPILSADQATPSALAVVVTATEAPASGFVPSDQSYKAEYEKVSLYVPYSISGDWKAEIVPADEPSSQGSSPFVDASHYRITFPGYPSGNRMFETEILVWPIENWTPDYNPYALEEIEKVKALIAQPETLDLNNEFPTLPILGNIQALRVRMAPLSFQNGGGFRFIAHYAYDPTPMNNEQAVYIFQGITDDGKYYVSAFLPISNPALSPTVNDVPGGDYNAFVANYDQYVIDITNTINNAAPETFTPNLNDLDYLIQSILISQ